MNSNDTLETLRADHEQLDATVARARQLAAERFEHDRSGLVALGDASEDPFSGKGRMREPVRGARLEGISGRSIDLT